MMQMDLNTSKLKGGEIGLINIKDLVLKNFLSNIKRVSLKAIKSYTFKIYF